MHSCADDDHVVAAAAAALPVLEMQGTMSLWSLAVTGLE